jgi:hypothetical protein
VVGTADADARAGADDCAGCDCDGLFGVVAAGWFREQPATTTRRLVEANTRSIFMTYLKPGPSKVLGPVHTSLGFFS